MNTMDDLFKQKLIIAGPCTFASYDEIYEIARELKMMGVEHIRGGAFKMRTNPNSFQGLQDEGMKMLIKLKQELGIKIVCELLTIEQIKKYAKDVDIIQIGARNMYNYELLKAAGKTMKPIILKRAFSASYKEWISAAEYIKKEGNSNIILCERGVRNFISDETRNILDIQAIAYIKHNTDFKIIVDPSHASGHSYMVEGMAKASIAAGADGLLIEVHKNPEDSLCDSEQTINFKTLGNITAYLKLKKETIVKL